jgi:hypothetical protein
VTIEQYAGIEAARAEGHPLDAILRQEGVELEHWYDIDLAFKRAITADPQLLAMFRKKRSEAEDHLWRRVTPLDDDLAAWMGFVAHVGASNTHEVLESHGLKHGDLARLTRRWQRRLDGDEDLRRHAAELTKEAPPAPATISAAPAALRPFPWTKRAATASGPSALAAEVAPSAAPSDRTPILVRVAKAFSTTVEAQPSSQPPLPFQGHRPPPPPVAPHLGPRAELGRTAPGYERSEPALPWSLTESDDTLETTSAVDASIDTTGPIGPRGPTLPFAGKRAAPPGLSTPSLVQPSWQTVQITHGVSTPATPFEAALRTLGKLPHGLTLNEYARLCAECDSAPEAEAEILARWGVTFAQYHSSRADFERVLATNPSARARWQAMVARAARDPR